VALLYGCVQDSVGSFHVSELKTHEEWRRKWKEAVPFVSFFDGIIQGTLHSFKDRCGF